MLTLTRVLSALLLAGLAAYLAASYRTLDPDFRASGMFELVSAVAAAVVGWNYLGARIDTRVVMGAWSAVQAIVVAAIFAMAVFSVAEVFQRGYNMEYNGLEEAILGFFDIIRTYTARMWDAGFAARTVAGAAGVGVVCVVAFRWFEVRRKG